LESAVREVADFDALVICGDLFDTSNPSPQLVTEVQRILAQGPKTLALLGNHDMVSDALGDNALGPLNALNNVLVVERPSWEAIGDAAILTIPFQPGDAREWFIPAVEAVAETIPDTIKERVLVFHLGVIDSRTPEFLAKAHDAIALEVVQDVMQRHNISTAFCGNWHSPAKWKRIVQCGALAPTGWDNAGWDYGLVRTLNTETGLISDIPVPGPRFLTAVTQEDAEIAKVAASRRRCRLYLSLKGEAATEDTLNEVRSWGVDARAVADTGAAREATRAAAVAVKQASTLDEALARYIAAMPLADGLDREQIRSLAAGYLSRGGTQ
jgi:DNA repair exonuclease SbcCD nuclease subunit